MILRSPWTRFSTIWRCAPILSLSGWTVHRCCWTGRGYSSVKGNRKVDYGSCTFNIWADNMNRLDLVRAKMLSIVGEQLLRHEMFTIDWHFSGRQGLSSASFDEMADPAP